MIARVLGVGAIALMASTASAQAWNSARANELAGRGVARRTGQLAQVIDGYTADAQGYLTFLGRLGEGALALTKVVQRTQLAVKVYWKAPASSKQVVVGMRDTLLLPADVGYYSDRFGIVQSNFPDRIRLGDGRDVADVPHPLSPQGVSSYDFAVVDSLSITTSTEQIDVFKLAFRPRDPRAPRAIGAAYLDVRNADIVQLELAFTRAAILDTRIEELSVILENQLVENRVWLPRRQTIEVVRANPGMIMNIRGIVRGRWDVCCYDIAFTPPPSVFVGRPISFAPPESLKAHVFEKGILDELPRGTQLAEPEDVRRAQRQAEELVSRSFRDRARTAAVEMPRLSDIARVTRAEGFALGAATRVWLGGTSVSMKGRYGFGDHEWKGGLAIGRKFSRDRALDLFWARDYVEARDVAEVSGVRNSIAAQEFGSDYTDPFDVHAAGVRLTLGRWAGALWRFEVAGERHDALRVRASPETGTYEPMVFARALDATRASLRVAGAWMAGENTPVRAQGELRLANTDVNVARMALETELERPLAGGTLVLRTNVASVSAGDVAPQFAVFFGGPTTAPGYRFDEFAVRRAVSQRVEWRHEVPFLPISLSRFGRIPPRATLGAFAHAVWVDDSFAMREQRQGWYPAVGIALEPLLGLIRLDLARGLRDGRWTFSADVARMFWPVL